MGLVVHYEGHPSFRGPIFILHQKLYNWPILKVKNKLIFGTNKPFLTGRRPNNEYPTNIGQTYYCSQKMSRISWSLLFLIHQVIELALSWSSTGFPTHCQPGAGVGKCTFPCSKSVSVCMMHDHKALSRINYAGHIMYDVCICVIWP